MKRGSRDLGFDLAGPIFVLGKGGVGKSVISEGLASLAHSQGRRALLVRIGESLTRPDPGFLKPARSKDGFDTVELEAKAAMDEYVQHVVRLRPLVERITRSEVYQKFFAAAPGLPELVLLGRIRAYASEVHEQGERRWDTIIVDCPSSGHGLLMLETPFAAFRAVPVGPFARLAAQIMDWLKSESRLALVAIPEEMAVVEAVEFSAELLERTGLAPSIVFLNRMRQERLSPSVRQALSGIDGAEADSLDRLLLECAQRVQRRTRLEAFHQRRLAKGLGLSPIVVGEMPRCRPAAVAEALAEALE